jgi:hypothetical protein
MGAHHLIASGRLKSIVGWPNAFKKTLLIDATQRNKRRQGQQTRAAKGRDASAKTNKGANFGCCLVRAEKLGGFERYGFKGCMLFVFGLVAKDV